MEEVRSPVVPSSSKSKSAVIAVAVAIWLVFAIGFGLKLLKPVITYDGTIYLGLVAAPDWTDPEGVRSRARSELERNLRHADSHHFRDTNPYRAITLHTPEIFERDLPFYQLKFGYVGLARLANMAGLDALSSLRLVSLVSYIALMLVPLLLIAKQKAWPFLIMLPAIWVGAGLREAVLIITPDLASAAVGMLLVAGWIYGSISIAVGAVSLAAIIRPEAFILSFGVLLASLALRSNRKRALLCFGATLCFYILGQLAFDYPGWWQHVSMSLYSPDLVVLGAPPLTVENFIKPAIGSWLKMFASFWVWAIIMIAAAYWACAPAKSSFDRRLDVLFWGVMLGVLGRAIVFPIPEVRIHFPTVVMLSVILALRADTRWIIRRLSERLDWTTASSRSGARPDEWRAAPPHSNSSPATLRP